MPAFRQPLEILHKELPSPALPKTGAAVSEPAPPAIPEDPALLLHRAVETAAPKIQPRGPQPPHSCPPPSSRGRASEARPATPRGSPRPRLAAKTLPPAPNPPPRSPPPS